MSDVYLYDDARARRFEPFALTRPGGELRAGALLVRERWERALGSAAAGHLTAAHLRGFDEPGAPPACDVSVPAGSWIVNARFAPALQWAPGSERLVANGDIVAVRVSQSVAPDQWRDGALKLADLASPHARESVMSGWWMHEVWDFIAQLPQMLEQDLPLIGAAYPGEAPSCTVIGPHRLFIEPGAVVEPGVVFDVAAGPVLLRAGAHVQSFTRLVGPLYIGSGSTVLGERVAVSSIGDVCKVHGELTHSIFIGYANKGHDGFVGHSMLGRWVNLGAGTITSNLKNTYGTVQLWTPDGVRETGLQFLGTLFGDHAKTGIGLRLTTGAVLGAGANVFGNAMPPKVVAPFAWGEAGAFSEYREDKFLDVAARVMERRHLSMSAEARAQLAASYAARWTVDR